GRGGTLRLPARGAALRRAAARGYRLRPRSPSPAPPSRRIDLRRERVSEDRLGHGPPHGSARSGRRGAASRARAAASPPGPYLARLTAFLPAAEHAVTERD